MRSGFQREMKAGAASGGTLGLFDYELPEELIAQEPAPERSASRLMVVPEAGRGLEHRRVRDLPRLLRAGDLLVLNDARVFPARLLGRKPTGGRIEVLLTARGREAEAGTHEEVWEALLGGSRPPAPGVRLAVGEGLEVEVLERQEGEAPARVLLRADGPVERALERHGRVPLPPYIRREPEDPRSAADRVRYQTVYASGGPAAAAPTAGLHFTEALIEEIRAAGVETARLTLEVGLGTFRPVRSRDLEEHRLHAERFTIPAETARALAAARGRGGRVVAVGTTVVRALEHAGRSGGVGPGSGSCDLFIRPGHEFRIVDALLTNFHLPRSTLLMLVSAFVGRERLLAAYREAVRLRYRFYSYGDAMFLERAT